MTRGVMAPPTLPDVFAALKDAFGPQHWWPADDGVFEVMVGAILTQNTAWTNVERAIAALKSRHCLTPERIVALAHEDLADMIRPAGYFNVKARRLGAFCRWYLDNGGYPALSKRADIPLREALLAVHGIGPETADDIMLYAFERPVFVVDAYTRRFFSRLGLVPDDIGYEALRAFAEQALSSLPESGRVPLFNEFHALIVAQGKSICRPKPHCGECRLNRQCTFGPSGWGRALTHISTGTAFGL